MVYYGNSPLMSTPTLSRLITLKLMFLSCNFLNEDLYEIVFQTDASAVSLWQRSYWKLLKVEADHYFDVLGRNHSTLKITHVLMLP